MSAPLAGRGRRLAATAIDMVLVPALAILLMLVTGVLEHAQDWSQSALPFLRMLLLGLASYLLLNLWLLWKRGQTAGKALLGIAIVRAKDGAHPGLWRLFVRGLFFPTLYLIVLVPYIALIPAIDQVLIFRKDRRCIHDWASGTAVVRREPSA
ncbi:MAG: RDD family protein [Rhizomicrobium sp.]